MSQGDAAWGPDKVDHPIPGPLDRLSESELERKRAIGRVGTAVLNSLTSRFLAQGFDWLLPVVFSPSTDPLWPDPGASIEKRVEVEIYERTVRATLSMIIHKMVACSLAYPKLFALSPNVRIERRERGSTGVHTYEFTQLDFEVRDASAEDIRGLVEDVFRGLLEDLVRSRGAELDLLGVTNTEPPAAPFQVLDRVELEEKYEKDWEGGLSADLRQPAWVVNIPREFYDFEDLDTGVWDNYDLFLPGIGEVLSGARRESEHTKISHKIERDEVDPANYELLLSLAAEGRLKPSAGAGIGLERLIGWIAGARHIGEVQAFPKVPGTVYDL
ncbi:MAG: asparagine synthetase A [Thermoplasmata archaeon]